VKSYIFPKGIGENFENWEKNFGAEEKIKNIFWVLARELWIFLYLARICLSILA